MHGSLRIASTLSMVEYAKSMSYHIQTFPDQYKKQKKNLLVQMNKRWFADGSFEVLVEESVRDNDVVLVTGSSRTEETSFADNELELYYTIDALRRASPSRLTVFEPYCAVSRSDRATTRNSVGMWVHYKILQSLGMDHYMTYMLHSDKSKSIFDPTRSVIDDLPTSPLIIEYILDEFIIKSGLTLEEVRKNWVFCAVDAGGAGVARLYANTFGTPLVVAHKIRNHKKPNQVDSIKILSSVSLEGKIVWVVDDMVDTGGSILILMQELKKQGASRINVAISHGVCSPPALARLQDAYEKDIFESFVITNTILPPGIKDVPFVRIIDTTRHGASVLIRMHEGESLSPFFDPFDVERHIEQSAHKFDH